MHVCHKKAVATLLGAAQPPQSLSWKRDSRPLLTQLSAWLPRVTARPRPGALRLHEGPRLLLMRGRPPHPQSKWVGACMHACGSLIPLPICSCLVMSDSHARRPCVLPAGAGEVSSAVDCQRLVRMTTPCPCPAFHWPPLQPGSPNVSLRGQPWHWGHREAASWGCCGSVAAAAACRWMLPAFAALELVPGALSAAKHAIAMVEACSCTLARSALCHQHAPAYCVK